MSQEELSSRPAHTALRGAVLAAVAVALASVTACGAPGGHGHVCTLRGAVSGITVRVAPGVAHKVSDAVVTTCWGDTCRKSELRLRTEPGDASGSQAPQDPVVRPSGSPHESVAPAHVPGFAVVRGLPAEPVRVTLTFRDAAGATVLDRTTKLTPKPSHPNGEDCPAGDPQGALRVTAAGAVKPG